jgi:hypothetical protein
LYGECSDDYSDETKILLHLDFESTMNFNDYKNYIKNDFIDSYGDNETFLDIKKQILELIDDKNSFNNISEYAIQDIYSNFLKENVYYIYERKKLSTAQVRNYGNFFSTEKSANEYIKNNKHNMHDSPFTYITYLNKNHEMKQLQEIIHKLAKEYKKELN